MEWWNITAVAGVVAAVKGMSEDTGNSPSVTTEALLLHEPHSAEAEPSVEEEEVEIEGKSFIEKLRWLHTEKEVATEGENYVRAARMKARIDRIQGHLRSEMEAHLAAMDIPTMESEALLDSTANENENDGGVSADESGDILAGMISLEDSIKRNSVTGAEAALGRGQFEMSLDDAENVVTALHRWSISRDVAWRACAVLAGVAGDHAEAGASCVNGAGGVGVIAVAMGQHPSDPVVIANALNALRWVAANGGQQEKTAVAKELTLVESAMALHIEDKWVQSHGEALMTAIADVRPEKIAD